MLDASRVAADLAVTSSRTANSSTPVVSVICDGVVHWRRAITTPAVHSTDGGDSPTSTQLTSLSD